MMLPHSTCKSLAAAVLLALVQPALGHSWVEQLQRIASNGTLLSTPGFIRGYVPHGSPGDPLTWLIPPNGRPDGKVIHPDDKIGQPAQMTSNYSAKYPMLQAAPGDFISIRYEENGHVSQPWNQAGKPTNRGTVFIYGTQSLSPTANFLDIHGKWNTEGTGGDGTGKLIATRNFDDGQCHQDITGNVISDFRTQALGRSKQGEVWCQADITLPQDLPTNGTYTLIWLWEWPTMSIDSTNNATVSIIEDYTSIMDIAMQDPCADSLGAIKSPLCKTGASAAKSNFAKSFVKGQDLMVAAVPRQLFGNNFDVAVTVANPLGNSNPSVTTDALQVPSNAPSRSWISLPAYMSVTNLAAPLNNAEVPTAAGSSGAAAPTSTSSCNSTKHTRTKFVTVFAPAAAAASKSVQEYDSTTTVYVTVTVGAPAPTGTAPAAKTGSGSGSPPTVTGFMANPKKARRGAGEWSFGHDN